MERTVKLKYSDLYFAELNPVIGFKQSIFQKKNTPSLKPCQNSFCMVLTPCQDFKDGDFRQKILSVS